MEDRMLSDEVLLALINKKGGGGGTSNYNQLENKPQINGVTLSGDKSASDLSLASLDANGKVPAAQLPSYVDDVINGYLYEGHFYEDSEHQTEITGESGKIYIDLETNKTYRWSGLAFVEISESLALGETASTAYAGDKGKANADAITAIKDGQTIDSFGDVESALADKVDKVNGKVLSTNDYTDADKAIVGGVTAALAGKQDVLTAGKYIDIDANNEISVEREIPNEAFTYVIQQIADYTITVRKIVNNVTVFEETYTNVNQTFDDAITIYAHQQSGMMNYELLIASDTHDAGFKQTMPWYGRNTYTEVFSTVDHSGEKLIIKSEMDTAINAIKDGQSIDSFADVETALSGKQATLTFDSAPTDGSTNPVESNGVYDALANKQNATDNSLQTTDKTVVGAVNELKSGLTNVQDDVKLNTNDLTTPSRTKNIIPLTIENAKKYNVGGTWSGNTFTYLGLDYELQTDNNGNVIAVVVSGSTSSYPGFYAMYQNTFLPGNYKISSGGKRYRLFKNGSIEIDTSDEYTFTVTSTNDKYDVLLFQGAGADIDLTYYPMVRLASDTDPTFAPYIPSVESRIEAVESYTEVNTIYKPEQRAWSGSSLVYNIPLDSANMLHFIACGSPASNSFVEAYFVLREQNQSIKIQKISEGLTITYDSTTKKTTVTLPSNDYWIERMEICARSV